MVNTTLPELKNPFRPGAGHMPPHLAGRDAEIHEFEQLLSQEPILKNLILTGLRGVGKTVLLETFRPLALQHGWLWAGTDVSESVSTSEANLATRLLADLSVVTSAWPLRKAQLAAFGIPETALTYDRLLGIYDSTPGLVADKLKGVLLSVADQLGTTEHRGIIFAYDEAQNLSDARTKDEFPLSVLLDVFQYLQRNGRPMMLVLTGLPTLLAKLVASRTYSERMFTVVSLNRLNRDDSRAAIVKPIEAENSPVTFTDAAVEQICDESAGYPYFIQFICRESFDVIIQQAKAGEKLISIPFAPIQSKLDADFFAGRWALATDRQRELLSLIATLNKSESEFTVSEIVAQSQEWLTKPFKQSHVSQLLVTLADAGLVYKNRWGKYSFAVPLFEQFILRHAPIAPLRLAGLFDSAPPD